MSALVALHTHLKSRSRGGIISTLSIIPLKTPSPILSKLLDPANTILFIERISAFAAQPTIRLISTTLPEFHMIRMRRRMPFRRRQTTD